MQIGLDLIRQALPGILAHLPVTLLYFIVPTALTAVFGPLLCMARLSRWAVLRGAVMVVVSFLRGTPALVQIYLVLYGLPLIFGAVGVDINDWSAGVFFIAASTFNFSAFVSESLRGAYLAMDRGQVEAGLSIGYGRWQNAVHVIIPQTLRTACLNLKNLEIDLLKGTSLAYTIGAIEMMGYTDQIIGLNSGVGQLWLLGAVSVIYFVLCALLEVFFNRLFAFLGRHEKQEALRES